VIFGYIGEMINLFAPATVTANMTAVLGSMIVLTIIFGAIFGKIYEMIQGALPGKGAMKGLNFGLIVWLVKDIAAGVYIALINNLVSVATGLIFTGFFMWIVYGYVLGTLYKK
jgi:hypothetical protein